MNHPVQIFIIGEPKSGTTALAQFLGEHPDIGIATPKEPHFFATDLRYESDVFHGPKNHHFAIRTREQYEQCFAPVAGKSWWADGSTHYLLSTAAAANIKRYNPEARIIAMFRNPADFLHSLHMQYINNGSEDEPDFEQALKLETLRKSGRSLPLGVRTPSHLFYSERARYAEQLQRFLDQFPAKQIKIIIMEEFNCDNQGTYEDVLQFLDIPAAITLPEFTVVHGSKTPRFKRLHKALNHPALKYSVLKIVGPNRYDAVKDSVARVALKKQNRQAMPPALRAQLMKQFEPEVRKLAAMINRPDLPAIWGYDK
jgi:hypothetical protein